ncbi:hypothetical protein STANM337S_02329 [Streptomyces tanashiensis]
MAEVTNADLQTKITDLRTYVTKVDQATLPTTDWIQKQLAPVNKMVEDLKAQQDKVADEVIKKPWEELMEMLGFDNLAKGIKKFMEDGFSAAWPTLLSGLMALLVPILTLALGAIALTVFRKLMAKFMGGDVITMNGPNGPFSRENLQTVQRRETRVANGGVGLGDLDPDANFDGLRGQLALLIPQMDAFNEKAPAFLRDFAKLPKETVAQKAASGVKKVADAIKEVDHQRMPLVSSGMGKITGAVRNSDPKKTKKFADAIGRLKLAMDGLEVDKVPKAGTLGQAADNAKRLADNTGTLALKMREFASTVRSINDELGSGAPA